MTTSGQAWRAVAGTPVALVAVEPPPPDNDVTPPLPVPGDRTRAGMRLPLFDLTVSNRPVRRELVAAFERVLARGAFSSGSSGVEVVALEEELAQRLGVGQVVGVGSGTAALQLALSSAGVGAGDEVILPVNTFFATAEAVFATGATPVLADVDAATATLDPGAVAAALSPRTAAIVGVHLYGTPVNMAALAAIARRAGVLLVEDAAQALGARWHGQPAGTLGHAAALSFYPTKNLGALGEGGAVVTDDPELVRRVRLLRSHGEGKKNVHEVIGSNQRLDELQAAFLRVKLARLEEDLRRRRRAAAQYDARLAGVEGVELLATTTGAEPARHLQVVLVPERDRVLSALRARGVDAAVHYPTPIHLQPACRHLNLRRGAFPNAERLSEHVLSLPFFPGITGKQIQWCVEQLASVLGTPPRENGR